MSTSAIQKGQRWRQISTGDEYVVTWVGKIKARFYRRAPLYDVTASIWIKRLLEDPDWELVDA